MGIFYKLMKPEDKKELEEFFVDNYDNIFKAKEEINKSLKTLGIEFSYDYDTFCKDFLDMLIELDLTYDKIGDVMVVAFVISRLIVNRMPDSMKNNMTDSDTLEDIKKKLGL